MTNNRGDRLEDMELKQYVFTRGWTESQTFHVEILIIWAETLENAQQQLQQTTDWQSFKLGGESSVPLGQPLAISTNIPL